MLQVVRYSNEKKTLWNQFVIHSKNATFLFQRDFMDYHQHRFEDYSLMVFDNQSLVGLLPANRKDNIVYSHQGLTYGGLILSETVGFKTVLKVMKGILECLENDGVDHLIIKPTPKIYHKQPADEIDYLLFLLKAELVECHLTSTIKLDERLNIKSSNRKRNLKKAKTKGLIIDEVDDPKEFWNTILIPNLRERFGVKPVHSLQEIQLLKSRFPKQIRHFNAFYENKVVAGVTVFETDKVAHLQYISTNSKYRNLGGLDLIIDHLLNEVYRDKSFFDFGISNENKGLQLNSGLMSWKESFGGRPICHQMYDIQPQNHKLLTSVWK